MKDAITMSQLVSIAKDKNASIPENAVEMLGYEPTETLNEELEKNGACITQEVRDMDDVFVRLGDTPYDGYALDVIKASRENDFLAEKYLSDTAIDLIKAWAAGLFPRSYHKIIVAIDEGALGLSIATKNITPIHLANEEQAKLYLSRLVLRHMQLANVAV